jgi:hypothetical protein
MVILEIQSIFWAIDTVVSACSLFEQKSFFARVARQYLEENQDIESHPYYHQNRFSTTCQNEW